MTAFDWPTVLLFSLLVIETLAIILLLRSGARRKREGAALLRKKEELLEAERVAELTSWQWDSTTDKISCSSTFCGLTGSHPKENLTHLDELSGVFTPESWKLLRDSVSKSLATGKGFDLELEWQRAGPDKTWIAVRGEAVRDSKGRVVQLRGTMQDITDRKITEDKLRDSERTLAGVVGSAMDAIITVDDEYRIVLFNAAAEKMLGCSAPEVLGQKLDRFIPEQYRGEHHEHIRLFGETGITPRGAKSGRELRALRSNGEEFPIEASISQVEATRKKLYTVVIRDVTERQKAEAALRESEQRFRLVANTAPVMIWMSNAERLRTYFNQPWLDFTGRSIDQELGKGWMDGVHAADLARYLDAVDKAFEKHIPFSGQYRLRRHDGEYRAISTRGVPRFHADGSFAGYIGICIDVTDEMRSKANLAELTGRLIHAQEEERARIARELHDDISQRLALLANRFQEANQISRERSQPLGDEDFKELWQLTNEIATDIQHMSHLLHPSKLHYLGLAGAARELCQEFSRQHKIEIECVVNDVPKDLDDGVSLGLFRTMQESLRNVTKHSQAHHVKVELKREATTVRLRVSDDGVGFDAELNGYRGLGLVSMQERLRLVGGELSIWSRPSLGTQIEATVPLKLRQPYRSRVDVGSP